MAVKIYSLAFLLVFLAVTIIIINYKEQMDVMHCVECRDMISIIENIPTIIWQKEEYIGYYDEHDVLFVDVVYLINIAMLILSIIVYLVVGRIKEFVVDVYKPKIKVNGMGGDYDKSFFVDSCKLSLFILLLLLFDPVSNNDGGYSVFSNRMLVDSYSAIRVPVMMWLILHFFIVCNVGKSNKKIKK